MASQIIAKPVDELTSQDLQNILSVSQKPAISIYIPTHQAGLETKENRIRFKNLIRKCQDHLTGQGYNERKAWDILEPAMELYRNTDFWIHQATSLAAFLSPGFFAYYRLPVRLDNQLVIGSRFYIKPLIPLLAGLSEYMILVLNQKSIHLFKATDNSIMELDALGLPKTIEELTPYYQVQEYLQVHSGPGAGGVFHAQGNIADEKRRKKIIVDFMEVLDRGLISETGRVTTPLVLAGTEFMSAAFREHSSYPNILPGYVQGGFKPLDMKELHSRSLELAGPYLNRRRDIAVQRFGNMIGSEKCVTDVASIVEAASQGAVELLFLDPTWQVWGSFDEKSCKAKVHKEKTNGDVDLLDQAVYMTLLNSGQVFAVDRTKMPEWLRAGASLRFAKIE